MKKILCCALISTMLLSTAVSVMASEDSQPRVRRNSDIVVEREDISTSEANNDQGFILADAQKSAKIIQPRGAKWNVWGDDEFATEDGQRGVYPIGYSEQVNDEGEVQDTYHYTRTYVNLWGSWSGDSGRRWGYGTVRAKGTFVNDDVWYDGVHTVKYGINDDLNSINY